MHRNKFLDGNTSFVKSQTTHARTVCCSLEARQAAKKDPEIIHERGQKSEGGYSRRFRRGVPPGVPGFLQFLGKIFVVSRKIGYF